MKVSEIKELNCEELKQKESEIRENLFYLRMQKRLGKLDKPSQLKILRKDLARVKTVHESKLRGERGL
ncbi:50S ribosomal protein L29 [PVC group bacterium (ex Bugula neritina AB1)]|nr:50S ribosomal protein L29 [PVC group bacterium (ex Bugula neritina AB1)]